METVSFRTTIDDIVRENTINRFASELEYLISCKKTKNKSFENSSSSSDTYNKRIDDLREILKQLRNKNDEKAEKERDDLKKFCVKLREQHSTKAWQSLLIDQQKNQLEKFFN